MKLNYVLLAAAVALSAPAAAQSIPARPTGPLLDAADVLTGPQEVELEAKLNNIKRTTGHPLVVVTVPDMGGYSVEEYSQKLFNTWGIGSKGVNDGVLLLLATKERKTRIHTGTGMEGVLPDGTGETVNENNILPAFKRGDFAEGFNAGVEALGAAMTKPDAQLAARTVAAKKARSEGGSGWLWWLLGGGALAGLGTMLVARARTRRREEEEAELEEARRQARWREEDRDREARLRAASATAPRSVPRAESASYIPPVAKRVPASRPAPTPAPKPSRSSSSSRSTDYGSSSSSSSYGSSSYDWGSSSSSSSSSSDSSSSSSYDGGSSSGGGDSGSY